MNYTDGYQLNQWRMEDRIQMQDFNADNAKIDAALSRHSTLLTDLSAHKGNCRVEYRVYTGTGRCGPDDPTVLTFSKKPLLVIVFGDNQCMVDSPFLPHYVFLANGEKQNPKTHYSLWSDTQLSFYSNTASSTAYYPDNALAQMNQANCTYVAVLFFAEDE